MKNINNSKKGLSMLVRCLSLAIVAIAAWSCDPTLDELSFELPEEGAFADVTPPTADFDFDQVFATDGSKVTLVFINLSTSAGIHSWSFGDGSTSTEKNPEKEFIIPADATEDLEYTIELTASDNFGKSDVISKVYVIDVEEIVVIPQPTDGFDLINTGTGAATDPVQVIEFSSEQAGTEHAGKFNFASNILDKDGGISGDTTVWTANDVDTGDGLDDGEFIIIDLGAEHEVGLIQFKTDNKPDPYGYQLLTSTTGTTDADFSVLLPSGGAVGVDFAFTSGAGNTDFQVIELDAPITVRYVKLITYGRFSPSDTSVRTNQWSNFAEIEFWTPEQ